MEPEITVLIPVRNDARFVAKAIESVLCQTFSNFKLIVSDNCSTDGTQGVVAGYAQADPRVTLVEHDQDVGGMGNFNRCLGMVSSKYYMLLCSDDLLWSPGALQKAWEVLEHYPDVSSVFCDMAFVDEDGEMILARRFSRAGVIDSHRVAVQCVRTARNWFGIPLLTRSARIPGVQYDPTAGYASDVDFSIAVTRGTVIYHIAELLIANRYHSGNATRQVAPLARRHMLAVASKHGIHLSRDEHCYLMLIYLITFIKKSGFFVLLELRRKWKTFRHKN